VYGIAVVGCNGRVADATVVGDGLLVADDGHVVGTQVGGQVLRRRHGRRL
jgi:hypothetical protein